MSQYTPFEEKLNYSSHLLGLAVYLFLCPIFLWKSLLHSNSNIAALVIYSVGLIAVFSTSSLYHFTKNKELKVKYRTLDHMAIFILIGGTYTPLVSKYIENPLNSIFLSILWTLLIAGIVLKFFFMGQFKLFSIFLYVFLGSMVLFIIKPIVLNMPKDVFLYTLLGGISYLIGVPFYMNKKVRYTHFVWHLIILVASGFHFAAIWKATLS